MIVNNSNVRALNTAPHYTALPTDTVFRMEYGLSNRNTYIAPITFVPIWHKGPELDSLALLNTLPTYANPVHTCQFVCNLPCYPLLHSSLHTLNTRLRIETEHYAHTL